IGLAAHYLVAVIEGATEPDGPRRAVGGARGLLGQFFELGNHRINKVLIGFGVALRPGGEHAERVETEQPSDVGRAAGWGGGSYWRTEARLRESGCSLLLRIQPRINLVQVPNGCTGTDLASAGEVGAFGVPAPEGGETDAQILSGAGGAGVAPFLAAGEFF